MTAQNDKCEALVIMKSPGNRKVVETAIAETGIAVIAVDGERAMEEALNSCHSIRMALIDVSGMGQSVWAICRKLQSSGIPFIVLSPPKALEASFGSLSFGASSVIEKPIAKAALVQLFKSLCTGTPKERLQP